METEKVIKNIHGSDLYGIFVEMGAGVPVSNLLFSVEGASKTVSKSISLYSKESQLEYGRPENIRSVSLSGVTSILGKLILDECYNKKDINFILVSSFQIGENICNHGWIGIYYKSELQYYHITIPEYISRVDAISRIGLIQINLLHNIIFNTNLTTIGLDISISKKCNNILNSSNNSILVFNPSHKMERLETTFRTDFGKIILFKGSFNPIHEAHLEMMEFAEKKYPNIPKAFCITLSNFDENKNSLITEENLLDRIKSINNLGYYAIILSTPLFKDTIIEINKRLKSKVILPMGYDTYKRCDIKDFDNLDYELLVFDRDSNIKEQHIDTENIKFINYNNPISSTKLRNNVDL